MNLFNLQNNIERLQGAESFPIAPLVQFALNGWTLGKLHGITHWQRVERNGIILASELIDGRLQLRENVNFNVVRCFAYLHDKCRISNGKDIEHGKRAALMISTIRETILKELNDEEIELLKTACKLHTIAHRTGNHTIDICFDADRLDLTRCDIKPLPHKMATEQGAHYAKHPHEFETMIKRLKS